MRRSWLGRAARHLAPVAVASLLPHTASAINLTPAAPANLDLSQVGRVAVAGDFDSISLYQYEGQTQTSFGSNGSFSLLQQYPSGAFASLAMADGTIRAMCPLVLQNGTVAGVVVGGNFTSLGNVEAQAIALWSPDTGSITPLPGLNGQVSSILCDADSSTVYVGGSFTGANSTNAMAWTTGWTNLPFAGFNGPVTSITKASNGNIVFGGAFDGLGNMTGPSQHDLQVIPISSANITAQNTGGQSGFSDPTNIICKTGDQDGSGNTWLLADNAPGFWQATFQFGFIPTKLRLYNTQVQGRGTKTFRYTALPIDGIMRFWYIDTNGQNQTCDATCPLPQNNETYQDFHFINAVGQNEFRIDISAWYGSGGGLAGIELFQDDIYSYAINDFNEPKCDGVSPGTATASSTGPWSITPSGQSSAEYLSATLTGTPIDPSTAQVVFQPNIRQSGNYSVTVYTPGCISDGSCGTRGQVNITYMLAATGTKSSPEPFSTLLYQTNNYDKYDQIYLGYVDMTGDSFRPSVTLTPMSGQNGPLTVVAQRVRYELISSTGGLNGLFEYDPNNATVIVDQFGASAIDNAGEALNAGAVVTSLTSQGSNLFVGGDFSTDNFANIFSVGSGSPTTLPGGGLDGQVAALYSDGDLVYVGGSFTNTRDKTVGGLNGIAAFNNGSNTWVALGSGVNGSVTNIVPFQLNLTSSGPEDVIAFSGYFDQVYGFGDNATFSAANIALWSPGRENWLHNLDVDSIAISGFLSTFTTIPDHDPLYAGAVTSADLGASDAVSIVSNGQSLQQLPLNLQDQSNSSTPAIVKRSLIKRATGDSTSSGASTAYIYEQGQYNLTVIGGHFTATASNGSTINNLLILNGSNEVTGFASEVEESSTILAIAAASNILFAGGELDGEINGQNVSGLVFYDLDTGNYASTQPPALTGSSVSVNAIAPQPSASDVYVGGNFDSAGSFDCASLCVWDTARQQWNNPGSGISGEVQALTWVNNQQLLVGGNLTANGSSVPVVLYNAQSNKFSSISGSPPPGAVNAACSAASDGNTYWVAGTRSDGSSYISKYDGGRWQTIGGLEWTSTVRAIQVFTLTENHAATDLLQQDQALMVLGDLQIPNYGNASAALYNGTTFTPYLLSNVQGGGPGSIATVVVQNPDNFFRSGGESPFITSPLSQSVPRTYTNPREQDTNSQ